MLSDPRYRCQVALPGFGEAAQELLQRARVLVAGAGGLGCPAAQYLAAAGVGTIGIADFDTISVSNLHRQILYGPADTGLQKAAVACSKLQQQNPGIKLVPHDVRLTQQNVTKLAGQYDIVVDGTDNFEAKYLLNDACVLNEKPLVYGAIYQYEGQVAVWNIANENGTRTPNYRDVFPAADDDDLPNCAEGGVLPTLAGIIGCIQANEVIKLITNTGTPLASKMLLIDALTMQSRTVSLGAETKITITNLLRDNISPIIFASDLKRYIDRYQLVDVRTAEERKARNIGGLHIPLQDIVTDTSYLSSGKPVVFYCESGKRSAMAVKLAKKRLGSKEVVYLKGGLQAWDQ